MRVAAKSLYKDRFGTAQQWSSRPILGSPKGGHL